MFLSLFFFFKERECTHMVGGGGWQGQAEGGREPQAGSWPELKSAIVGCVSLTSSATQTPLPVLKVENGKNWSFSLTPILGKESHSILLERLFLKLCYPGKLLFSLVKLRLLVFLFCFQFDLTDMSLYYCGSFTVFM